MNRKKKILFLVTQSEFGGAQRFIYNLISGLTQIKTQIDAEIVVGAGPEGDDRNGLLFALEKKGINTKHLKYLRRSVNPFFDFLGLLEIRKLIKKEKPDILFLCSSKAGFLGSFVGGSFVGGRLRQRMMVIYRIGGWSFNDPWPDWKKKIYIKLEKHTAKFKDIIINNAESDRKQAIKLGIKPKEKIITIYNGIDTSNLIFLEKKDAIKRLNHLISNFQFPISNKFSISNFQLIGTVANLYSTKGIEYLIQAANILKDKNIKFIVIGEGKERRKLKS